MEMILGIDFGTKRIGLAIGDSLNRLASPLAVVSDIGDVARIIKEEKISRAVVGLPLSSTGGETMMVKKINHFIRGLDKLSGLPIEKVDERLSSMAADSLLGAVRDKAPRDAVAAMLILQAYFDQRTNIS